MRAVNLLPRDAKARKFEWNGETSAALGFTLVIVVAVIGGFLLAQSHASSAQQQLASAQAALDAAKSKPTAQQTRLQIPGVLQQAQPWHLALDTAISTRVAWDTLLSQLEYVVPAKVLLTSVSFGAAGGTGATTGATSATVALGGTAYSLHDVGVFLATLARVPKLTQVNLVSTTADTSSKTPTTTFSITAQVNLPAVVAPPTSPTNTTTTSTTGGQA
jgi:Tfp pilus assembly protein PilN